MAARILVVEDEPDILELVRLNLLQEGFDEDEIRKIMGENVIRVLRATLPEGGAGR